MILIEMFLRTSAPEVQKVCSIKNYRNILCPRGAKQHALQIKQQCIFKGKFKLTRAVERIQTTLTLHAGDAIMCLYIQTAS